MSLRIKILIGLLLGLLFSLIFLESNEPEEINWFESYAQKDKIPYGTQVLFNTLKESREGYFNEVFRPPFEFLADSTDLAHGTYFFLNSYIAFDEDEAHNLLKWVSKGNTLYVGAKGIGETILDTLGLDTEALYQLDILENKPVLQLTNDRFFDGQSYYLDVEVNSSNYFDEIDTLQTIVLGEYDLAKGDDTLKVKEPNVHFIKQQFGEGTIVLHLMPDVFTNYFILKEKHHTYTQNALQYIPKDEPIYWDNHYKNGKTVYTSPLYIFFRNRYLKWAIICLF